MERPSVYIILLNWNGAVDTIECLESLKKCRYENFHVVVLDNASKDDSVVKLREYLSESAIPFSEYILRSDSSFEVVKRSIPRESFLRGVELIISEENLGFCAGNNRAMEFAVRHGADYLLVLNNDTVCEVDFLDHLVNTAMSEPRAGLIGGVICYYDEPDTIWWAGGGFNSFLQTVRLYDRKPLNSIKNKDIYETDLIIGCMMLIPRNIFLTTGGFDERFFIWSEDWDLSLKVRMEGYRLIVNPQARIYHKVGRALGILKPLDYYYGTRNNLILKKKYLHWFRRFLFISFWLIPRRIVRYIQFAMQGRFDLIYAGTYGIIDYFRGKTDKWERHEG